MSERARLKKYATALQMWTSGFDTKAISDEVSLDEPTICRWIWNWLELRRAA